MPKRKFRHRACRNPELLQDPKLTNIKKVRKYRCLACQRNFYKEKIFNTHLSHHVKCQIEDCDFSACLSVVNKHYRKKHMPRLLNDLPGESGSKVGLGDQKEYLKEYFATRNEEVTPPADHSNYDQQFEGHVSHSSRVNSLYNIGADKHNDNENDERVAETQDSSNYRHPPFYYNQTYRFPTIGARQSNFPHDHSNPSHTAKCLIPQCGELVSSDSGSASLCGRCYFAAQTDVQTRRETQSRLRKRPPNPSVCRLCEQNLMPKMLQGTAAFVIFACHHGYHTACLNTCTGTLTNAADLHVCFLCTTGTCSTNQSRQ